MTNFRKSLAQHNVDYYDTRAAINAIQAGAYDALPYTSRVLAEQLVRKADENNTDAATLNAWLGQLINRKQELDFPWYPARVVCHDILGQTALVDLAGLRDAIADQGGDPSQVNPVVPTQLIVDDWERERITADPGGEAYVHDVLPVKLAIDAWYISRSTPRLDVLVAVTLLRRFVPGARSDALERRVRSEVPEAARVG